MQRLRLAVGCALLVVLAATQVTATEEPILHIDPVTGTTITISSSTTQSNPSSTSDDGNDWAGSAAKNPGRFFAGLILGIAVLFAWTPAAKWKGM